ncbi:phospholipid-transporting ATPase ABCA3-like [Amblyomma americanum]
MLNDEGARWSNLRATGSPYDNVTLVSMSLVVCAYCVVYAIVVWYLDNVWPWQYGIPKEPLFFAKMSYWTSRGRGQVSVTESTSDSSEASAPMEGIGDRTNPGIVLNDVTKASNRGAHQRHAHFTAPSNKWQNS